MKPGFPMAVLGVALMVFASTAKAGEKAKPPADAMARAQAAAKDFSTSLKAALAASLSSEGAPGSIAFCHDEAPKIAARVAAEHGVRIGRVPVSGRQRNPANAPETWQAEGLAAFQASAAEGTPVSERMRVVDANLPRGIALRLMRGIPVEPACLACHGPSLAPETRAALEKLYPADAATGFEVGDLRGALWVEVPEDSVR